MRANKKIKLKERRTLTLKDFKGVDFSSSALNVAPTRSPRAKNFIFRDGLNQKRNGWEELHKLQGRINGIHPFTVKSGNKFAHVVIVHSGDKLYKMTAVTSGIDDKFDYSAPVQVSDRTVTDARSQSFVRDGCMYLIGVGMFLRLTASISGNNVSVGVTDIADDAAAYTNAYVPTTTINIDDTAVNDEVIATLEAPNRLTRWRKNTLLGRAFNEGESSLAWELDDDMDGAANTFLDITAEATATSNDLVTFTDRITRYGAFRLDRNYYSDSELDINLSLFPKIPVGNDFRVDIILGYKTSVDQEEWTTLKWQFLCTYNSDDSYNIRIIHAKNSDISNNYQAGKYKNGCLYICKDVVRSELYQYLEIPNRIYTDLKVISLDILSRPAGAEQFERTYNVFPTDYYSNATQSVSISYIGEGSYSGYVNKAVMCFSDARYGFLVDVNYSNSTKTIKWVNSISNKEYDRNDYNIDGKHVESIAPPVQGEPNITVTFKAETSARPDLVTGCTFGTMFGADGRHDRLFLSGNAQYPNIDVWSESDNFTYFPEGNTQAFGGEGTAVTGYVQLSDNTLAVLKGYSGSEPCIYYRTGNYTEEHDAAGNLTFAGDKFAVRTGMISEGCVSPQLCASFDGDAVIVSDNGVFGIVLGENITTGERYAKERSTYINTKLRTHDLKNAVSAVYNGKLYIAVDGVCYVADRRFKSYAQDSRDDAFNYEWWYWDHIPCRVLAVVDGELWFGDALGKLYKFSQGYSDREKATVADVVCAHSSGLKRYTPVDGEERAITGFFDKLTVPFGAKAYDNIELHGAIRRLVLEYKKHSDPVDGVYYPENAFFDPNYLDGARVKLIINGNVQPTEYTYREVKDSEIGFYLEDAGNNRHTPTNNYFGLVQELDSVWLTDREAVTLPDDVEDYDGDGDLTEQITLERYKVRLSRNSEEIVIAFPDNVGTAVTAHSNVVAEWYTPMLDMGAFDMSKSLISISVANDPNTRGKIELGFQTRRAFDAVEYSKAAAYIATAGFDMTALDFTRFSFDEPFATSYTKRVPERNFTFIRFVYTGDSDDNCQLKELSCVYKINRPNRGIR